MLIMGIDDAGRGPIIGPMMLAGVLLNDEQEKILKKEKVTDSKLLDHKTRIRLSKHIRENVISSKVVKSEPEEIDNYVDSKLNLNTLEAVKTAEIINSLNSPEFQKEKIRVIIDCPSVNILSWLAALQKHIKHTENLSISCEHKADFHHTPVSAASILAKVAREEEMDKLRSKYSDHDNMGSGYPADPITVAFLKKHGKSLENEGLFRKSWSTWKALFPGTKQSTLKV